jgi:hypothetical protein
MKFGALRGFEQTIWHHPDELREAAGRREPDPQVWLFLHAPNHPWHGAHAYACGWVVGSTIFDQGVAAYTIVGDIVYDLNGKPTHQIIGNWFYAYGTNEGKMWVDSDYETGGRRIPPWREEEVQTNAEVIKKSDQFKATLLTENADTSELCAWLRDERRETPPHVLDAVAMLDKERAIEASGTEAEKRWWHFGKGQEED